MRGILDKLIFLPKKKKQDEKNTSDEPTWNVWNPPPLNRTTEEIDRDMNDPTISIMDRRYVAKPRTQEQWDEYDECLRKDARFLGAALRTCVIVGVCALIIIFVMKAIFGG